MYAPIGPYVIERRLAIGGMAEVYVAHRKGPHGFSKKVALKRILPQFAGDPDFVSMFIDEAKLAASLHHPNVVQVFDFGEHGGELFLAMELVEGTNANKLLRTLSALRQTLPLDSALYVAAQTARALAYAHRLADDQGNLLGFVHRDVSPANILLTASGHVKLADFGIAKITRQTPRTEDGHVRGKLGYMSPEQVMGKSVDGRSDVFTLATVLAELLIGEPLFGTGRELDVLVRIRDVDLSVLARHRSKIPKDVRRLLDGCLVRNPADRPSAAELAEGCDEIRRRRGMSHGPERLARILQALDLVEPRYGLDDDGPKTALVNTSLLSPAAEQLVRDVGVTSPQIYRVRFADGREQGPMSFPKLVQLVTSGRVHGGTLIGKEGAPFVPAQDFPELTRFVTSPALQWRLEELARAEASGSLDAGTLLPIAFGLVRDRRTGVLHLWDGERRKKIYFVEGRPEFIGSTDTRELFGEWLVEHGYCYRMEVEMALALLPRYGGRLGDALVGLGVMRPMELFKAITAQVRDRFLEAFRWRRGRWAFVPDARSHEETFPLGDSAFVLLREAVAAAHLTELEATLAPLWERLVERCPEPLVPTSAFDLPSSWLVVLDALGRRPTTPGALFAHTRALGIEPEVAYRALTLAISCGLVVPVA
ncbi:MAG: protein kinase [Myxococcales bacterium]|nr:protein kinase [Myxococcales bacterium]